MTGRATTNPSDPDVGRCPELGGTPDSFLAIYPRTGFACETIPQGNQPNPLPIAWNPPPITSWWK